ncbi:MAG TPA: helix-turn-helix domain-containing protein [Steroidobacteraceae bacterium]|nr:helix-turn-helix domain-containing protein [Steroidobacteraceae bacterium]
MESWSVSSLPGRAKAIAWSDFYSQRIEKVSIAPADQNDFDAQIQIGEFGPLRVMQMSCGRCCIDRAPYHIARASGRVYTLVHQARGRGTFAHYGHEAQLGPGDFTLCHGEAPYAYQLGADSYVVMVRVPANVLKEHLPSPDYFCGRHLGAGAGLTEAAATLIARLCVQLSTALSADFQHRVARHLLDMVATSYAIAFEAQITSSSNVTAWHARAKLYIEQHLRRPDLSPCAIAEQLKLSPRYLRTIFASGNETVSAYILRRRLEECARQIEDPRWNGHSITEIAFSFGFNSAPHFTRSFRDRYGVSPRRFRQLRFADLRTPRSPDLSERASSALPQASPLPG